VTIWQNYKYKSINAIDCSEMIKGEKKFKKPNKKQLKSKLMKRRQAIEGYNHTLNKT
jgi:hypothetical protein